MQLKNMVSVLFVKDIEVAKAFYSSVLQQEVRFDFGTNCIYTSGFALWQLQNDHVIPTTVGVENTRNVAAQRFELSFETDDIDAVYAQLKQHAAVFLHELLEEPWGQRTLRFFDPDKHIIEVGETMAQFVLRFYKQGMTITQVSERTSVPVEEVERIVSATLPHNKE